MTPPAREVAVCFTFQKYAHPNETWYVVTSGATEYECHQRASDADIEPPDAARWDCVGVETVVCK